jgi:hypothetical protein
VEPEELRSAAANLTARQAIHRPIFFFSRKPDRRWKRYPEAGTPGALPLRPAPC